MSHLIDNATRERVVELRKEGMSYKDIAEACGISRNGAHKICKKAGLPKVYNGGSERDRRIL